MSPPALHPLIQMAFQRLERIREQLHNNLIVQRRVSQIKQA
jgi:hypothetical protein